MVRDRGKPKSDRVLGLLSRKGVIRPRDLDAINVPREYLRRMCARGVLDCAGRGLYIASGAQPTENQTLAVACTRVPHAVVCLLSALQFHDLTTQAPFEVWMAIGAKTWLPKADYPPMRFVRFSPKALAAGVQEHRVGGVVVRVFSPAKTVADCFKYRNKIGLDVAIEALRDCWKRRRATMDDLWRAAVICRVANVMRPYFESLT